jgi:preprotein translocase subunit SecF
MQEGWSMENSETHDESQEAETNGVGAKVREISAAAKERAQGQVKELSAKARDKAQERVEEQRERIASRMENVAADLKQHAEQTNRLQQEAERRVATGMATAASYLHSHRSDEVAEDVGSLIRRHPILAVVIALLAGYLLARLFR